MMPARRIRSAVILLFRLCVALFLLSLFACVLSFVSALVIVLLPLGGGGGDLQADCAVVFGAAVYGDRPGPAVVRRVETAAQLYREGSVNKLIFTGGKGGPEDVSSEAEVMAAEAMSLGVARGDIALEAHARSTLENIRLARPLTHDCESVLAISDRFHMARIRLLASREGWNSLRMAPTRLRPPRAHEVRSSLRETIGYVYYALHIDAFVDAETIRSWRYNEPLVPETPENSPTSP